jgi:TldD protein
MSTDTMCPKSYFFEQFDVGDNYFVNSVCDMLHGADDGELYMQSIVSENMSWEEGRVDVVVLAESQGFGLRRVEGGRESFAYGSELDFSSLSSVARNIRRGGGICFAPRPAGHATRTEVSRYPQVNPLQMSVEERIAFLKEVDAYIRKRDTNVHKVELSLSGKFERVCIIQIDGSVVTDVRPLIHMKIVVYLQDEKSNVIEAGSQGFGGRDTYAIVTNPSVWQAYADETIASARLALEAGPCPAGAMPVVLGPGWAGVILHEAIGHGLEGDFISRGTSVFGDCYGERIAVPDVTIVDDGTMVGRRGSLSIDDEGTPSEYTVLIENGKLVNYMHSRLSARLLGAEPTGNGRRESYRHLPLVRMTNTYMLEGPHHPHEIIEATNRGIYCTEFQGGEVDITNGKFVFVAKTAFMIENGKLTRPVKGASLIGTGYDVLTKVDMVGSNMELDSGIGTCGKNGQGVPVGVGQPTIRVSSVTVGGTEV